MKCVVLLCVMAATALAQPKYKRTTKLDPALAPQVNAAEQAWTAAEREPDRAKQVALWEQAAAAFGEIASACSRTVRPRSPRPDSLGAIWEHNFGREHPSLISGLVNLSATLVQLERPAGAKPYAQRALAIAERSLGAEHPKIATALAALGDVQSRNGECADALPRLERALAIF